MQKATTTRKRINGSKIEANIWDLVGIFKGTSIPGDKAIYYWGHPEEITPEDLKIMYKIHRIPMDDQFRIENVY